MVLVLVLRDGVLLLLVLRVRLRVLLLPRGRGGVQRRVIERRRREGRKPSKRGHAASASSAVSNDVVAVGRTGETNEMTTGRGERCRVGRV